MRIDGSTTFLSLGLLRVASPYTAPAPATTGVAAATAASSRGELFFLRRTLSRMEDALKDLQRPLRSTGSGWRYAPAESVSINGLALSEARAASLDGYEEVNTAPTSYSPFGPTWSESTTLTPTVDGVYDGAAGSGQLTVEVLRGGIIGRHQLRLRFTNPDGSILSEYNVPSWIRPDTLLAMGNGLTLNLGEGRLERGDTFTIDLFADIGSRVDPDAAFDGLRNDRPNFDYRVSVQAGGFMVNGVFIEVRADDTVNSVLQRITDSAAGVNAYFDEATETVRLEQKTSGAAFGIELGADSSGFLAAVKLDGSLVDPGRDEEINLPLDQVARFAGVTSGEITVNGSTIAIDVTVDTVLDILARITDSLAGVEARLDPVTQIVSFISKMADRPMVLDDGGTGLLPALGILPGTHEPQRLSFEGGMAPSLAFRSADALEKLAEAMNDIFGDAAGDTPGALLLRLRGQIHGAVGEAFDDGGDRFRTSFGLSFDFRGSSRTVMRFGSAERQRFVGYLRRGGDAVRDLMLGSQASDKDGLVGELSRVVRAAERDVARALSGGGLLDTLA